ncbi:MAG: hypothetical protein QW692_00555 [Nitrososphaerota archaeon]
MRIMHELRIIVKRGFGSRGHGKGSEGYANGKGYCPKCKLVFQLDPPIGKLYKCVFCGHNLRHAPKYVKKENAPRIDPLEYLGEGWEDEVWGVRAGVL